VDFFVGLWLIAMLIGVYFIPTIVAVERNVVNKWSVAVINAFLGWTLIGWVVALAMALRTATEKIQGMPLTRDQGKYSAK
jgi:hypothetical protein